MVCKSYKLFISLAVMNFILLKICRYVANALLFVYTYIYKKNYNLKKMTKLFHFLFVCFLKYIHTKVN